MVDSDILPMIRKSVSFNVSQFFSRALPLHLLCDGTASDAAITPQVMFINYIFEMNVQIISKTLKTNFIESASLNVILIILFL